MRKEYSQTHRKILHNDVTYQYPPPKKVKATPQSKNLPTPQTFNQKGANPSSARIVRLGTQAQTVGIHEVWVWTISAQLSAGIRKKRQMGEERRQPALISQEQVIKVETWEEIPKK